MSNAGGTRWKPRSVGTTRVSRPSVSIDRVRRRRGIVAAVVFVLGMAVLIGGLVATAETVLAGVLISTVGLLMMVAVAVAVIRWRRRS